MQMQLGDGALRGWFPLSHNEITNYAKNRIEYMYMYLRTSTYVYTYVGTYVYVYTYM